MTAELSTLPPPLAIAPQALDAAVRSLPAEPRQGRAAPGELAQPLLPGAAFPALFQAVRAVTASSRAAFSAALGATVNPAAPADGDNSPPAVAALPGLPRPDAATLPATSAGNAPGDALPEGGTDLPPADLAELVGALLRTDAGNVASAPAQPVPQSSAGAALPAPSPAGQSAVPVTPARQVAMLQSADASASATDPADGTAWASDTDARSAAPDVPAVGKGMRRDPAADAPAERGMDLTLTAEFRARLDALLHGTQRPSPVTDTAAGAANLTGPSPAATPQGTAVAASSMAAPDMLLDALPVLEPLGDRDALAQGLGERLLLMADKGLQSATLKLQPEHLGPMEIRISVDDDGSAQVHFSAHQSQTRDALENAIPRLRELFAEQGLSLMQANVDSGRNSFAQRGFPVLPAWLQAQARNPEADAGATTTQELAWRLARRSEHRVDLLV